MSGIRLHGVLVTYRRRIILQQTLGRLSAQTRQLDDLVVVDNGSDPEVEEMVRRWDGSPPATYLDPGDNIGPAGGFARGMSLILEDASDDDWILLLDDDDPPFFDDALENAVRFAESMVRQDPMVGAVGVSGGRFDMKRGRVIRIGDAAIHDAVVVDHITGGGMPAYRVQAVRTVGVTRPELFFGFEELEYGLRMGEGGYHLYADGSQWMRRRDVKRELGILEPEHVLAAKSSSTSVRVSAASWRRYYSLRNLVFILRERGAGGVALWITVSRGLVKPLLNLFTSPGEAGANLAINWRAARDAWRGRMGRRVDPGV